MTIHIAIQVEIQIIRWRHRLGYRCYEAMITIQMMIPMTTTLVFRTPWQLEEVTVMVMEFQMIKRILTVQILLMIVNSLLGVFLLQLLRYPIVMVMV